MANISEALAIAQQHHQAGRLRLAEEIYHRILEADPHHADAMHLLGVIAHQAGDHELAIKRIRRALVECDTVAAYHNNLGEAYRAMDQLAEAAQSYRRAILLRPDYAEAHNNLGLVLQIQEKRPEALACFRRAVALKPCYAKAHFHLAYLLQAMGQTAEAIAAYRQALDCNPNYTAAWHNLAHLLAAQGQYAEAVPCYEQVLQRQPDPETHHSLGWALQELGRMDEAIAQYCRALDLAPTMLVAYKSLGAVLKSLGRFTEAKATCQRVLELEPDDAETHSNLGTIFLDEGALPEALASVRRASELRPDLAWTYSNYLAALHYTPDITPARLYEAHAEYETRYAASLRAAWRPFENDRDPERPLRVGFVSPHLYQQPVGYFLIRALEHMDPAACQVVCYYDRPAKDSMTARFQAVAASWRDVVLMRDEELAEQVRDDRIDILFDLAGHAGANRQLVFARKPAPVQITWLDYEGTTGLKAIDYLLGDRYTIPPGAERWCHERVLRMPDGFVCYDPPAEAPEVGPLPALERGAVSFASFNLPAKINAQVVDVWAAILHRVPDSRLWLKYRGLNDPAIAARFHQLFAERGVAPHRVLLEGWAPYAEFLRLYQLVDIALDPFPYSGGLTTCEALWMGVPVITCPGETFASRHGLSHLTNIGLTETIATSPTEYVDLAERLACDLPRLAALRAGLREQVARSPLCDGERFANHLLGLLRDVWRDWCQRPTEAVS